MKVYEEATRGEEEREGEEVERRQSVEVEGSSMEVVCG
jgi:hypothetical protein